MEYILVFVAGMCAGGAVVWLYRSKIKGVGDALKK